MTTSSKIISCPAAGENTPSKLYVLLFNAFGPIISSIRFPLTPSVLTTTLLFSFTSLSLRPLDRT